MNKRHITLTESDKTELEAYFARGKASVRGQKRAYGLRFLDQGMTYQEVSQKLGTRYLTVSDWAKKYREDGLGFLKDKPRSGRPALISGEERAKITAIACSKAPEGYARWSLRLLAGRVVELEILPEISHATVGNILKKTNSSPIESGNGA